MAGAGDDASQDVEGENVSNATRRAILAQAAGAAVLTACGGGGTAQPAASGVGKKQATVVVHSRAGAADHSAFQQTRIPIFKEKFPNIELRYEDIPGDQMRTKLLVLAAGGSIGDLAWNGTFVGSHELLAKGTFQPVEKFIKADKFDTKPYLAASLEAQKYQGQIHGLPFIGHYGCNAIYYNQDLLTKAGVQPPPADATWTTDNLVDMARKVTASGLGGFIASTGIQECGVAWLRTFGGELLMADGKKAAIDSPESVAALQWLADTIYKQRLADNFSDSRG